MPFVLNMSFRLPILSPSWLTRRFAERMLRARRERRVARIWFLKQLCEGLNLLGERLNLLLEFLDLRFITGDEGLDEITSWFGFRWEFEVVLGCVHLGI